MNAIRIVRYVVWAAVVVLVAGIAWVVVIDRQGGAPPVTAASIGGPFSLTDQNGNTVTEKSLLGHPTALFFGYTFCPDVCPTTLADLTLLMDKLGPDADKLKVYFVTVDPERDNQEAMGAYLRAFDPRFTGLTGSRAAIDQIIKDYRVFAQKVVADDGSYTMNHTATVYLLDRDAKFVSSIDYQEKPETALAKLKNLIDRT
jgi:protein SCO1/2